MSESVQIELIKNLPLILTALAALLGGIVAAVGAAVTAYLQLKVMRKTDETKAAVNGHLAKVTAEALRQSEVAKAVALALAAREKEAALAVADKERGVALLLAAAEKDSVVTGLERRLEIARYAPAEARPGAGPEPVVAAADEHDSEQAGGKPGA